jgi:hypothetical protein
MKKLIYGFVIVCCCQIVFGQPSSVQHTFSIVIFKFNNYHDSSQTSGNYYNNNDVLLRDTSYQAPLIYNTGIDGAGDYCIASNGWDGGYLSKYYYVNFSTLGYTDIRICSHMKSSPTGPREVRIQYRIGATGIWNNPTMGYLGYPISNTFPTNNSFAYLPTSCNNQPDLYVRWIMASDTAVNGSIVDAAGTCSIDNIIVQGYLPDSSAYLDINKIKANIYTGGLNFYGNSTSFPSFEYPKDSGKNTIFCSALWIGGKNQGNLHLAGERYHGNGRDYYPGPIMDAVFAETEIPNNWDKVWKINKSDIDYHIAHWNDVGYVIPPSIANWPAYGIPALGINYHLAPYVDVDSDSAYIPSNGDYPEIRGDQAIYFIFNDSVYPHTETGGKRLGVEVHAMAYAYNTVPLLDKTVFMNYLVYNRSNRIYDSLYMGLFTDIDLGYPRDDYIGCDTLNQSYFGYNGDNYDETGGGSYGYGSNPPVQTVTMLNQPMTSFAYFNNTGGGIAALTDPSDANAYYLLMKNYWKDGRHFCFGGCGHKSCGGDSTRPVRFMFPGYPNDSTQWNERSAGNAPADRRGVGLTGPLTLSPGQYISFDAAYITADSGFAKSTGFSNVDNMLYIVPLIRDWFNNNLPQDGHDLALGIHTEDNNSATAAQFNVYPNPSSNRITFTTNLSNTRLNLDIMDINGRLIKSYECNGSNKVMDVSGFKNGVYILKISSKDFNSFVKFIKM